MKSDYNVILEKLKRFAFKKSIRSLLKGILHLLSILVFLFLFSIILENLFYLNPRAKLWLIGVDLFILTGFVVLGIMRPIWQIVRIKFTINERKLIEEISQRTNVIEDKLINLYELSIDKNKSDLLIAGINQKVKELRSFNFNDFINYRGIIRFFTVYIVIVSIILLVIGSNYSEIEKPFKRIIDINQVYEKPSPYKISILNDNMDVGNGDKFRLRCKILSEKPFSNPMITFGGNSFYLSKDSLNYYSYQFNDVNNDIKFILQIDKFKTKDYTINVLSYPYIKDFEILVDKPKYTRLKSEILKNINHIEVPVGALISVDFKLANTDSIKINNNGTYMACNSHKALIEHKVEENEKISVSIKNSYFIIENYLNLSFSIIEDSYPDIYIEQREDSIRMTRFYFKGRISDDYGFSNLMFHYKYNDIDSTVNIDINRNLVDQEFYFAYDFTEVRNLNDAFEYFFEVVDNDQVNGVKSSFSSVNFFKFPSRDEIIAYNDSTFNQLNEMGQKSMEKTFDLQDKLNELQKRMINESLTDWEKKEFLKDIVNDRNELNKILQDIKELNSDIKKFDDNFSKNKDELIEKQMLIEKLVEDVMSDELQKLMEDLAEMMDKFNDEKFNSLKEKMDVSLDDLSEQLDRNIEMLRRMQLEKKLNILNDELKDIIENEIFNDSIFDIKRDKKSLLEKELEQKMKFKNWKANFNSLFDLNDQLENKVELFDIDNETKTIDENYDKLIEKINKERNKNIDEELENNINDLNQLSYLLNQMINMNFKEEEGEDIEQIKQILENLLVFSFDQEDIMYSTTNKEVASKILVLQSDLANNFKIIKDSIYSLARRQPQIGSVVNKEIVSIENSLASCMNELRENRYSNGAIHMQRNITSTNNLALIFSDILKQMNQNLASKIGGNCNKPGKSGQKPGGKPSMGSLKNAQKSFQKQLEMMMKKMQSGEGSPTSGDFGKALYQQEMLSEMMREMMNDGSVGSSARETLKKADEILNEIRTDVLNNNINNNTLQRQKSILTRLLEAENADMEREKDKKRESEIPVEQLISKSAKYFDNNVTNDKFEEKFERNNLKLRKFYYRKFTNFKDNLDVIRE